MTLATGHTLAHYRILGPLGAGAMGEVYRAVDTRLEREVAVKVLPEHFADDDERVRRFEREAKSLASLNHPNVAQIYGVDKQGSTYFIALELVPGETLEERLKRAPLPLDEALDLCRQIAEGLEAAHEQGVIHRDLKPANIRITPDGRVKLLDFGLAKPARLASEGASATDSALSTEQGRLLGTPTYMAPEQARGKPIDRRVDVWAFGCVLFECLSGERAFRGDTLSDVLAAILERTPDLARLSPNTPSRVRELVARCFEKDPRQRLRDVGDARLELERALAGGPELDVARSARSGIRAASVAVLVVAAAALAWLAARASTPQPKAPPLRWLQIADAGYGVQSTTAISPDGSQILYGTIDARNGVPHLFARPLDREESRQIATTLRRVVNPFFAPDGARIGGFTPDGLFELQLDTELATPLVKSADYAQGAWSSSGGIVFAGAQLDGADWPGLAYLPEAGGTPRAITHVAAGESRHTWPEVLPDGRSVLFTVQGARSTSASIAVGSIDGADHRILLRDAARPRYSSTGHLLYGDSKGRLMASAFDAQTATLSGEPTLLAEGLFPMPDGGWGFDVSAEGTLVYTLDHDVAVPLRDVLLVDRAGKEERLGLERAQWIEARLSPDAQFLALRRVGVPDCSLWVFDRRRSFLSRVPVDGDPHRIAWSADGKSLLFRLDRRGRVRVCRVPADGSGAIEELSLEELDFDDAEALADGSGYVGSVRKSNGDLDVVVIDGATKAARQLTDSPLPEYDPSVSPDGRWLAYCAEETERSEVYVRRFDGVGAPVHGLGARVQISAAGGFMPRWSRDGRELYFIVGQRLMCVQVGEGSELVVSAPTPVFPEPFEAERSVHRVDYDVGADRNQFVVIEGDVVRSAGTLHVVLNWPRLLERSRTR